MKTWHQRCAGLDVHKVEVVACLRLVSKGGRSSARCAGSRRRRRIAGACRVAGGGPVHDRGDGGDRRVLEAGLAHSRRPLRAGAGERGAHQGTCRAARAT